MPSDFVNAVTKHNLSTWYLLPLIYLNKASFGEGNFVESYVNAIGSVITVEIVMLDMCHKDCLASPYLMGKREVPQQYAMIWYYVPSRWRADFAHFKAGRFSQFSDKAKHNIEEYSGLFRGHYADGQYVADARIQALERSPELKRAWEEELVLETLPDSLELMPIPSPRTYREYDVVEL